MPQPRIDLAERILLPLPLDGGGLRGDEAGLFFTI